MAKKLTFQQRFRQGSAVQCHKGAIGAARCGMHMAREYFLARTTFPGDQHGSIGTRNLRGPIQQHHHGRVFDHGLVSLTRHGLQHGSDEFGIGWKGQEFLGAGTYGAHSRIGIIGPPAGNDGAGDTFFRKAGNQPCDIMGDVAKYQISTFGTQSRKAGGGTFGNGKARTARHGNTRGLAEFCFQRTNDQDARHFSCRDPISRFPSW